ncbi:hypothetical protein EMPS_00941 [Entomortierella parvispora]|uniref:Uncharacterized protein n=1 Tax=Entomortierella parvispora TaxID=205924 RepID=A0A9P3H1Y3_9FUNG|nr:hypothetical protein EMPS_00941 [Entomortierella parvispora]
MRILSVSLGLAAIALVAAQADPLAANGPQSTFEWASDSDLEKTLALQYDALSEQQFRATLLSSFEVTDFQAEGGCGTIIAALTTAINTTLTEVGNSLNAIPLVDPILKAVAGSLTQILNGVAGTVSQVTAAALGFVVTTLQTVLGVIGVGSLGPVAAALNAVVSLVNQLAGCQGTNVGLLEVNEARCGNLADLYRSTLEESIKINPALNLPEDASEELKRLTTGTLALLDLMSKTSIAKTNDALLSIRPIFAADLLTEYRSALLRLKPSEDIRNYAEIILGTIVGSSNSLEACLRVAADPAAALEDLNEELDEYEDEDEDEDYDDEDDEDDDDEDDEDESEQ